MNQDFLKVAQDLAMKAGELALSMQNNLGEVQEKQAKDYVTKADLACDKLIREAIIKQFPEHGLITEENSDINVEAPYQWHIDPIDGTNNYAHSFPLWAVLIGLEHKGEMQIAVAFCPAMNELYYAVRGEGAFCNGKAIKTSTEDPERGILVTNGINIGEESEHAAFNKRYLELIQTVAPDVSSIRSLGTAGYASLMVARGAFTGYIAYGCKSWDLAAVSLIVEEAGGICKSADGSDLDLKNTEAGVWLCSQPAYKKLSKLTLS